MLIKVSELRLDDVVVTIGHPSGATIKQIESGPNNSVKLEYVAGDAEWYTASQIVFRRDKPENIFVRPVYNAE